MSPAWRIFALAMALGASLRFGAALAYRGVALSPGGDDVQYVSLARSLAEEGAYRLHGAPSAYRLPLYPAFLAAGMRLGARSPGDLRLWQAAFSLVGIALVFLIGRRLHSADAGAWGALALALYPEQVLLPTSLYCESFYAVWVLAAAWLLLRWRQSPPSSAAAAPAGLALGATLLVRSALAPVAPLLAGLRIIEERFSPAAMREALLLVAMSVLPLVPWTLRNALGFERFIPFESGVIGPVVWYASQGYLRAPSDEASVEPLRGMYRDLPHTEWDSFSLARALPAIAAEPGSYLLGTIRRLALFVSDAYLPYLLREHPAMAGIEVFSRWERISRIDHVLRGGLFLLALLSLAYATRPGAGVVWLLALSFGFCALGTVFARFFSPLTPLLCALAGPALARMTRVP